VKPRAVLGDDLVLRRLGKAFFMSLKEAWLGPHVVFYARDGERAHLPTCTYASPIVKLPHIPALLLTVADVPNPWNMKGCLPSEASTGSPPAIALARD